MIMVIITNNYVSINKIIIFVFLKTFFLLIIIKYCRYNNNNNNTIYLAKKAIYNHIFYKLSHV